MNEQKITAIVLRAINHKEKDKILTVLSPEMGKISLLMRGVRSQSAKMKFAAGVFSFVEYMLTKTGDMWLVTGATEIESFFAISSDPEKYKYASAILELVDKVSVIGEQSTSLFLLLIKSLKALAFGDIEPRFVFLKLCVDLFELSGYSIAGNKCSSCGAEFVGGAFFNTDQGCLVCSLCKAPYSLSVSVGAASVIRILSISDFDKLPSIKTQDGFKAEVETLFVRNIAERFNCKLKSLSFL